VRLLMEANSRPTTPQQLAAPPIAVVGAESVGKSTLVAALTGASPRVTNVAGSTLAVEAYRGRDRTWLDTPGVLHHADTATTRATLDLLAREQDLDVLLVLRATHLDEELAALLPLVAGRRGAVAVTGWDRVEDGPSARRALASVAAATGVAFVPLDARSPGEALVQLRVVLAAADRFTDGPVLARVGWRIEPPTTVLERRVTGPLLGLALLLLPTVAAVTVAVLAAGRIDPLVVGPTERLAEVAAGALPWPLPEVLAGDFGLLTMGPLLVVWALPTIVLLALLLGLLEASGLLDRLTTAVHPLVRPFGLTGRDLVRVVAGHGCNVPAVTAARSCSACSHDPTLGAIAFGAACSYQLAATVAVLAAARRPGLVVPYLAVLLLGGLVHARLLTPRSGRAGGGHLDLHLLRGRAFLVRPRWRDVRREAGATLRHAGGTALPVFAVIAVTASLLAATGALDAAARGLGPLLAPLRLPGEVAAPVVLASVRKDGVLLLSEPSVAGGLDGAQLLATLVLAGALLPCLVTSLTILRERGWRTTTRLLRRQVVGAVLLAGAVSWLGAAVSWLGAAVPS
jgi:ferrous iron transport protein B